MIIFNIAVSSRCTCLDKIIPDNNGVHQGNCQTKSPHRDHNGKLFCFVTKSSPCGDARVLNFTSNIKASSKACAGNGILLLSACSFVCII